MFIAMWNWADDYGVGDATPIRLIGFAFPNDEIEVADFPPLREEISERFNVVFYKYQGRPFYYIPSWEEHQRTEKRAFQRVPFPHELENPEISGVSEKVAENPPLSDGTAGAGSRKREIGNRKKEEEHTSTDVDAAPAKAVAETDRFKAFWDAYEKKVGRGAAFKAWKRAIKKTDPDAIVHAAAQHADWHRRNGTEPRFFPHAATWLNEERWGDERPPPGTSNRSTTDTRVSDAIDLANRLAEQEAEQDHPVNRLAIGQNK